MADSFLTPYKFLLFITDRCNLVCKMCPIIVNDPKAKNRKTLPRELAFQAADFARRRGFKEVEVAGGEATVVDYFWELLGKLCECDAEVRLVTNGLMTTDEHIAEYKKYPNLQVQVSIDGTAAVHDGIRGIKGAYDRSVNTLERLVAAGCQRVSINTVVQRTNWFDMVETYEALKRLPYLYHAFSLLEANDAPKEAIPADDFKSCIDVLKEVQRRAQADGKDVVLSDELIDAYRIRLRAPHFLMHPGHNCSVVRQQVVIFWDGNVIPCFHYAWNHNSGKTWNMHEQTLDEIFDSDSYQNTIRKAISMTGCTGCSTMCYNWDPEFRDKVMNPSLQKQVRQQLALAKEYLRNNHPGAFSAARRLNASLRGRPTQRPA